MRFFKNGFHREDRKFLLEMEGNQELGEGGGFVMGGWEIFEVFFAFPS